MTKALNQKLIVLPFPFHSCLTNTSRASFDINCYSVCLGLQRFRSPLAIHKKIHDLNNFNLMNFLVFSKEKDKNKFCYIEVERACHPKLAEPWTAVTAEQG